MERIYDDIHYFSHLYYAIFFTVCLVSLLPITTAGTRRLTCRRWTASTGSNRQSGCMYPS
ncbi:hypothetical protein BJ912DRAFT_1045736 [Pholiota molesta]|nr:hypothetical protein BJ912DRAFT_1045736 [Pholiota molesta]